MSLASSILSLASRGSVLGKAVLGLGFFCVLGIGLEPCVLDSTSATCAIFDEEGKRILFYTEILIQTKFTGGIIRVIKFVVSKLDQLW